MQICRSWKEIGIRKADRLTPETGREIVANNEARPEWCKPDPAKPLPTA